MDKFYLAKLVANERKNEIDHDLAIRHMLKETERGILRVSKTKALILMTQASLAKTTHCETYSNRFRSVFLRRKEEIQ